MSKIEKSYSNEVKKIFAKDKDGIYLWCNENYATDLNLKPEDITGKTDFDLYNKSLAKKYRTDDANIIKSGKTKDIEEKYEINNKKILVHTIKTPIRDKNGIVTGVLGVFWDTTNSREKEEKLAHSEERYRAIFEKSPIAITLIDKKSNITDVNPRIRDWTGYEAKDVIGLNSLKMPFLTAKSKIIVAKNFAKRLLGEKIKPYEIEYINREGEKKQAMLEGATIKNSEGQIIQILIMFADITLQKKAEAKLQEKIEEIEKVNRLMTGRESKMIELKEKIKKLEEKKSISLINKTWEEKFQEATELEESIIQKLKDFYIIKIKESNLSFLKKAKIKKMINILAEESKNHEANFKKLRNYEKQK